MKFKSFIKNLQKKKNVAIFTHDNPDPDCIASALIFEHIAKKLGVRSKIFYSGYLTRSENKAMVEELNIKISHIDNFEKNKFDGFAIVDTQKNTGNNSLPCFINPDFTFDHHKVKQLQSNFYDINVSAGATSTIILQYFLKLGLFPNQKLATAYCYALISETKDLNRGATSKDVYYFKKFHPFANIKILSKIRHAKKSISYFYALKKALNRYKINDNIITCFIGDVSSADYVSEIADIFIGMKEVEYSLVIGKWENKYFASSRTSKESVNLGSILHQIIKKYGTAGGHNMIAAGQFQGDPNVIIKAFIKEIK